MCTRRTFGMIKGKFKYKKLEKPRTIKKPDDEADYDEEDEDYEDEDEEDDDFDHDEL